MTPPGIEGLQRRLGAEQREGRECEVRALRAKLRDALARRAREEAARGIYRCVCCRENYVDPVAGEDTCVECIKGAR